TGSMADDVDANKLSQGENGIGDILWSGNGSGCRNGACTTWTYKLAYEAPSRISTVKNALGDSVSLLMNYAPLASWSTDKAILSAAWQAGTVTLPTAASL